MPLPALMSAEATANVALSDAFAGLAVIISLTGAWITWRIHKESGGRVSVQMLAAAYQPYAGSSAFITNNSGKMFLKEERQPVAEMCRVVIENPGRLGVTVTGVQLNIEGRVGARYTVTPRSFMLDGIQGEATNGETYFRLDAYDRRTVLFDYWSVVDAAFQKDPGLLDIRLSAEVTVAGHPNPFTSVKKGYWRIHRNHISAIGGGTIRRPRNTFLLEMLRVHTNQLSHLNYLGYAAVLIEESLSFPATKDDWEEAIKTVLNTEEGALTRHQWADELNRHGHISTGLVAFNLATHGNLFGPAFRPLPRWSDQLSTQPPNDHS